ncbi:MULTISPECIES: hypothetical protein [unclassified Streptomyces]|nr:MULTISPECIES: hypothetical protein [unclassified Streptomyces]
MAGLQATAGNAAVVQMIRSVQRAGGPAPAPTTSDTDSDWELDDDAVAAQKYIEEHVPDLANWAREMDESSPYDYMTEKGALWGPELDSGAPPGRAFIASRSQKNITSMEQEIAPDEGWQDAVRAKLEAALSTRQLHHYTTRQRAEKALGTSGSGHIDSKVKLLDDNPGKNIEHNTQDKDEEFLANDAFVFFFISEADAPFRKTRFTEGDASGPARIALPLSRITESGWIMLNDFIEIEHPTLRSNAEGELLSYRRDDESSDKFHSPEGKAQEGRDKIKKFWRHFRELDRRAKILTTTLSENPDPSDREGILALADLLKDIKEDFTKAGVADGYRRVVADARGHLERGARFNSQVRRFDVLQDGDRVPEHGSMRYMKGAGHRKAADARAAKEVQEYTEYLHNNTLAGPHAIKGLALRGVLEISRIERQGGHDALVNRLKNMSGDELANVLLKDFIRPQAMIPWSVAITRGDVQYP